MKNSLRFFFITIFLLLSHFNCVIHAEGNSYEKCYISTGITLPSQPFVSISSTSVSCATLGAATITAFGTGPYTYTWMPGLQTGSVATGLSPGTYTIFLFDVSNNATYTYTIVLNAMIPISGTLAATQTLSCFGAATGTAAIVGLTGTSSYVNYLWTGASFTSTAPIVNNLTAGVYTVTVTDALTSCQFGTVFTITQPPPLNLNLAASSLSSCVGFPTNYTISMNGGSPGYSFSLSGNGSVAATFSISETIGGTYIYTLTGVDANSCAVTNTFATNFIPFPNLSVSDVSICPLETATLSASGATSYTWQNSQPGNTFTASPSSTSVYTVTGANSTCTASATASVTVKQLPVPVILNNSPFCQGDVFSLSATGGASYLWNGPLSFTSNIPNPTIANISPSNSGVYNLTITGVNNCTANVSTTITINPAPTISLITGTTCANDTLFLSASSFSGASYFWSGPLSFFSTQQNPAISNAAVNMSGNYTVFVTSIDNCTNVATSNAVVKPLPLLSVSDISICPLTVGTLTVSGANSYIWSDNSTGNTFTASPAANTQYTVTGSTQGCTASAVASIFLSLLPIPFIVSNSPVCETTTLNLSAGGGDSIIWKGPSGFVSTNTVVQISPVNQSHFGNYTVTVFSAQGCSTNIFTSVEINPAPIIIAASSAKSDVCVGTQVVLSAIGGFSYQWFSNLSTQAISGESITIHPMSSIKYTVTGSDTNGCKASVSINLNVNECVNLKENILETKFLKVYPNPASNEINIELREMPDKKIQIISIYGQEVFSEFTSEQKLKLNISELPPGTYFIYIQSPENFSRIKFVRL